MSPVLADEFFTSEPPGKKPCKLSMLTILTGMRCNLIVVLIFISLIISDVEPFFSCAYAHLYVLFGKMSIQVLFFLKYFIYIFLCVCIYV